MPGRSASVRKVVRQACDGCRIRKIKCTELPPCAGCTAAGIQCTFKKVPRTRGPRTLRPRTVEQITQRQRQDTAQGQRPDAEQDGERPAHCGSSLDGNSMQSSQIPGATTQPGPGSGLHTNASIASLVLRLCIFRLRLYPVWPIVAIEDVTAALQKCGGDTLTYALANAVGAATMAQLKLDSLVDSLADTASASSMESECHRAKAVDGKGRVASLDTIRIAFFLHVYHENLEPGGVSSLLYLREAITLAQIMGLHRESTYATLPPSEQEMRRRIVWLLFVTERGVAMLHNLPVVLRCNTQFPSSDGEDESHVFSAFRKLVNLFWTFDQSGAFDILQDIDANRLDTGSTAVIHRSSLEVLQQRLQDMPIDWESSNDVQRADICVTRQWMRAVLWRISLLRNSGSDHVTSLSHPIQIAQEFLSVISKLPTAAIESHGPSIEFKIFEIASAVATDAMTNNLRAWTFPQHARDILNHLHRILTSCRGGNVILSAMLRSKIAQIQQNQPLLLQPSSLDRDLIQPDRGGTPVGFSFELNGSSGSASELPDSEQNDDEVFEIGGGGMGEPILNSSEDQLQMASHAARLSWPSTGEGPSTILANSWDLYEQLQSIDNSFDGFEAFDIWDPFMTNEDLAQNSVGRGFANSVPPSPGFHTTSLQGSA